MSSQDVLGVYLMDQMAGSAVASDRLPPEHFRAG
jgi:hypothetical protein